MNYAFFVSEEKIRESYWLTKNKFNTKILAK